MWAIFAIPATGVSFFISAWLLMLFWGILAPDVGVKTISYWQAVLTTLALWIVVAPLIGAVVRMRLSLNWSWRRERL